MIARASAAHADGPERHLDGVDDVPAQVYARPHEIDVDRHRNGGGIEAVVRDVRPLADMVRIELERRDGAGSVEVKLVSGSAWRLRIERD